MAVLSVCHGATGQAFHDGGGWIEAPNSSWVAWSLHSGPHGYRRLCSALRSDLRVSKKRLASLPNRSCHCARIRLRELFSFSRVQLSPLSSLVTRSSLCYIVYRAPFRSFLSATRRRRWRSPAISRIRDDHRVSFAQGDYILARMYFCSFSIIERGT